MTSRSRTTLALTTLFLLAACDSEPDPALANSPLRFSAIPNIDAKFLKSEYEPIAEHLSRKLGITVEYIPAANYAACVSMFANDEIQLSWFGGLTGAQARHIVKGARAIAKGRIDANYRTYFIAPKSTPLTKSDSFPMGAKGGRFTFGDKLSTSGRLMPEFFIRSETKSTPQKFFAEVNFSGSHSATIKQVANGSWDLGAVDFAEYDKQIESGQLKAEDCPIVWVSPPYADYQFTARPGLDARYGAGFTKRLTEALLQLDEEMCRKFRRKKMVPASDADFKGIIDIARQLELLR
jgi:phosphonate transport system substrate-binding protein